MQSCQNCGHESHCNTRLQRTETDYNGATYPITVCEHCRCDSCQTKEQTNG